MTMEHRLVVWPAWQGFGIGTGLSDVGASTNSAMLVGNLMENLSSTGSWCWPKRMARPGFPTSLALKSDDGRVQPVLSFESPCRPTQH